MPSFLLPPSELEINERPVAEIAEHKDQGSDKYDKSGTHRHRPFENDESVIFQILENLNKNQDGPEGGYFRGSGGKAEVGKKLEVGE